MGGDDPYDGVADFSAGLEGEPLSKPRWGGRPKNGKPAGPPPPEVVDRYERLRSWRKGPTES